MNDELPGSVDAIRRFLEEPDIDAKLRYVHAHPYLLTDDALRVFGLLLETVAKSGDADFAETLSAHRALLERSRQAGAEKAFAELRLYIMTEKIQEFIDARSWMDSYVYLENHPELTYAAAREALIMIEQKARDLGYEDQAKIVRVHARLLHLVETKGMDAAFTEVGGKDFLNSRHPDD
ncbi:MAG TPA: hypothetical protein VFV73_16780 [Streptosporangiaceae bacterium]|nr:hypothetical protein [Streptosporangiaceae bacterium]